MKRLHTAFLAMAILMTFANIGFVVRLVLDREPWYTVAFFSFFVAFWGYIAYDIQQRKPQEEAGQ